MVRARKNYPPDIELETTFGKFVIAILDSDYLRVQLPNGRTIRKKNYQISVYLHKEDEVFVIQGSKDLHIYRSNPTGNSYRDRITKAVRQQIQREVLSIINDWAMHNSEILKEAHAVSINNEACYLEQEIQKLENQLKEKRAELRALVGDSRSIDS